MSCHYFIKHTRRFSAPCTNSVAPSRIPICVNQKSHMWYTVFLMGSFSHLVWIFSQRSCLFDLIFRIFKRPWSYNLRSVMRVLLAFCSRLEKKTKTLMFERIDYSRIRMDRRGLYYTLFFFLKSKQSRP